jgi:hypothetical protein
MGTPKPRTMEMLEAVTSFFVLPGERLSRRSNLKWLMWYTAMPLQALLLMVIALLST